MHPNAELLTGFYRAFAAKDGAAMTSAYDADARFSDPVFVNLHGAEVGAMWRLLCSRATDLRVVASDIAADDQNGRAHWEAWYTFSKTGRMVHNAIDATFEFRDGKIIGHCDQFDLRRWAGMALGPSGKLLGWSAFMQNAIRREARAGLAKFMAKTDD